METLVNNTVKEYSIWNSKGYDEFIDEWLLMRSPIPIALIFSSYLLFVLKLGPDYMNKRPPFALNHLLLLYNIFQVGMSIFVFQYGTRMLFRQGILDSYCEVDRKHLEPLAIGIYYYLAAKVSELFDTVFFVLRKKYNQISFLHVYHHTLMMLSTWYTLKYEPTPSIVFLGTLNSLVHVVMYSYYALSTFPALTKYLWWKKYITTMQLIQFGLIILQVTSHSYVTGCPPSYFLLSVIIGNAFLMIYLFSDFYVKSYTTKSNVNRTSSVENERNVRKSDDRKFSNDLANDSSRTHEKTL